MTRDGSITSPIYVPWFRLLEEIEAESADSLFKLIGDPFGEIPY